MTHNKSVGIGYDKPRFGRVLILGFVLTCASPLAVAHGLSGQMTVDSPGLVQMIDGKDPGDQVGIGIHAPGLRRDGYDFGFMDGQTFHPLVGWCNWGNAKFSGGTLVDFALRKRGTSDNQYFRLSDTAGYATQDYSDPVNPSDSRNPVVTDRYYRKLTLFWDLDHDHDHDMKVMLWTQNDFDGMRFVSSAPTPVPLPSSVWLLSGGMFVFAFLGPLARRRSASSAT